MEYTKFRGIVIKGFDYLESDKLLTILTFEKGMVTVKAKGVRKKGARLTHCTQQFFCGDFECVVSKGRYILTDGSRVYDYSEIAEDINNYYHACHYLDIASAVIMEDHPDEEMLRLLLNVLHLLIKGNINRDLLTPIYELRTAAINGFAPITDECVICGGTSGVMAFSIENGGTACCIGGVSIDADTLKAVAHISESSMKELFALKFPDSSLPGLKSLVHNYLESVMDRKFSTLDGISEI